MRKLPRPAPSIGRRTLLVAAAFALLVFAGSAAAALFSFGSTDSSISPNRNNCGNGFKNVSVLTSPKAGTLNTASGGKVEGYFDGTGAGSGTQAVRMIVYAIDANGAPQGLLGVSAQQIISAGAPAQWRSFSFPSSIAVPAGKIGVGYWCGGPTSNLIRPFWDANPGTLKYNTNTYSSTGNPSNPFGNANTLNQAYVVRVTADDGAKVQFGVSENIPYFSDANRVTVLNSMQAMGSKLARFDFAWSVIEPTPGAFNVTNLDTSVSEAQARGQQVVAMIGYAPSWANGGHSDDKYPPVNASDYGNIAGRIAAHFGPMGVHVYEIWNEPNLGHVFWKTGADPAKYAQLLQAAYPAIKAADPQATVLAGATAFVGAYNDGHCDGTIDGGIEVVNGINDENAINFMQGVYANGGGLYFDAWSHHPYDSRANNWTGPCSGWAQMWSNSPSLRSTMDSEGDHGKKLWATEYGNKLKPTCSDGWSTEADQAARLTTAMNFWKGQPDLGPLIMFNQWDSSGDCFGVLGPDFTQRQAWTSFHNGAQ
jgi:Cellulase (glycosyl hydrolase family 5)